MQRNLNGILLEPKHPIQIPSNAQWVAGQGAGSWFSIQATDLTFEFKIKRFSPEGSKEFEALFIINNVNDFCINCPYAFTYLSHFKQCQIIQHGSTFKFVNKLNLIMNNYQD